MDTSTRSGYSSDFLGLSVVLEAFRPLGGYTETISRSLVEDELEMSTRRQRIAELLEDAEHPLTAQDVCDTFDIKSRSIVYEDLEHISRSVKREGKQVLIRPASCGKCGYVFASRKSVKRPSRCPKCRSQWIVQPAYLIRRAK
ncbi:MAG: transcriptional regulator [Candidatus Sifarchaeia archaeon]